MGCREAQRDSEGRVRRLVTGIGSEMNQLTVIEMGRRGQNPEPQRWSQWSILVSSLSVPWGVSGSQKLHLSPMGHAPEVNNLSPCGPMPILSVGLDEEINLLLKMQVCEWSIRAGGGNSAIFLAHEPVYSFHLEPQHFELECGQEGARGFSSLPILSLMLYSGVKLPGSSFFSLLSDS